MKFATLTSAIALFATAASALDKPLDIKVTHAVECTRKTQAGKRKSYFPSLCKTGALQGVQKGFIDMTR
jgi:hypothetical protein